MSGEFTDALVAILAAMLIVAAIGDLRTRIIPNPLNAAIALTAIPFWFLSGLEWWPDIALRIAMATALFGLFAIAFSLGAMGGGDVKMVAALALWLPFGAVLKLLLIMSLAGGVLTLAMLARQRVARSSAELEVPYGVAIAFGGMWLIGERFFNQFG